MRLKPGAIDESGKRRDEIWSKPVKAHSDAGIFDCSIGFDEGTLTLFVYRKLTEENTADNVKNLETVQKWRENKADLRESHPGNMPACAPLHEVLHMD